VFCEERERLRKLYLSAVGENLQAARECTRMNTEAWKEATKKTQDECDTALGELNRHKTEHGC
jgi:hypothetical protein